MSAIHASVDCAGHGHGEVEQLHDDRALHSSSKCELTSH